MASIGIVVTWGYNYYWDLAYNIGRAALQKGHTVKYFLYLDGTLWPLQHQSYAAWDRQPKDQLAELIDMGAEAIACRICINARGLRDGEDYIDKVGVKGLPDFADMVGSVDRLITL